MSELTRLRGGRGLIFLSDHPWAAVVVLLVFAGLVYYQTHRKP